MKGELVELSLNKNHQPKLSAKFNKQELRMILNFYAREVHQGKYKDYAVSLDSKISSYHFFRKNGDKPVYFLLKNLANKRTYFTLLNQQKKQILKTNDLSKILSYLSTSLTLVS